MAGNARIDSRDSPPAKIGGKQVGAAEGAVGRVAHDIVIGIFDEHLNRPVRAHAHDAGRGVAGDVEVAVGVDGQAVEDRGWILDHHGWLSEAAIFPDWEDNHTVRPALDHIETVTFGAQTHAVGKVQWRLVPQLPLPRLQVEAPDSRTGLARHTTIRDVQTISRDINDHEVWR